MYSFWERTKDFLEYFEYVPLLIITLLLVAEEELEKRALHLSFQIAIMIITATVFFALVLKFGNGKTFSALVCIVVWIVLVYAKKQLILK